MTVGVRHGENDRRRFFAILHPERIPRRVVHILAAAYGRTLGLLAPRTTCPHLILQVISECGAKWRIRRREERAPLKARARSA